MNDGDDNDDDDDDHVITPRCVVLERFYWSVLAAGLWMIYWNKHTTMKNAPISLTMLSLSISCSSQLVPSGVV